ncbi:SRPBCC family protein [Microbacterium capsulatum]|uniref:SRPBCC family protein n=1 Tax=Microbacterium capsulatum TaxID=3041921 RepID=A0ABU0XKQ2_9MICO|nr:SRPBCC family protein [Microbacterium sp. ASV81]MDQ4215726.1 SRPBCC family protein [Microbacterium sp. ASV81]
MPAFALERLIPAPVERVFALSLDVAVHVESMTAHDERIVGGVGSGLMREGDTVTWDARHFGVRFRMTSLVFDVDPPHGFSDRQLRGPFAEFRHRHTFTPSGDGTLLRDEIEFRSPFGLLGRIVDALVMRRHLIRLIEQRNDTLERRSTRP